MSTYKDQLLDALRESGWEQHRVDTDFEEWWWFVEMWVLRSVRASWGFELFISFELVYPLEAPSEARGVDRIVASARSPRSTIRRNAPIISELSMLRGRFDENLAQFVEEIDQYRGRLAVADRTHRVIVQVTGPMPPFYEVAEALWGEGSDFDSDGDSSPPNSTEWRELTLQLRPDHDERIDIDPLAEDRDRLNIRASSTELLDATVAFLVLRGSVRVSDA